MRRGIATLLIVAALTVALTDTRAQTPSALSLSVGAPIPGGLSSGGNLVLLGGLAPFGGTTALGGRYDVIGGLAAPSYDPSTVTLIDLTVSFYSNPAGAERAPYEEMIRYFADGVFEQSNGAHKLRTVTIFTNGERRAAADIVWVPDCWPNAHLSGYGVQGLRIEMCDRFSGVNFLQSTEEGGYVLAHEWGHYFYSLYDEYRGRDPCSPVRIGSPCIGDTPVEESVMNSQWNAAGGNFAWLNFSTGRNDTRNTAQHRVYRASGWETLGRPPALDPRTGTLRTYPVRRHFPALAQVAPAPDQPSRIDLVAGHSARSALRIVWVSGGALQAAAQDSFVATVDVPDTRDVFYPEPIRVLAVLQRTYPITGAAVQGELIAPDGTRQPLALRDDGVAPDVKAGDGLYAGLASYAQEGAHTIRVRFTNPDGAAREVPGSGSLAPPPPGANPVPPVPIPVTEAFDVSAEHTVAVRGMQPDDHGDTPQAATPLALTNADLTGRIDRANDRDVFRLETASAGQLAIRVTDLALGMQPQVRLLAANGTTVLESAGPGASAGNDYLLLTRMVNASEVLYLEVRHSDPMATQGFYRVSAGSALASDQATSTSLYLPLIRR